jgi:hypothetical protein
MGNLGGFNHGYGHAFREMGWEVDSFNHRDFNELASGEYDLFLLRDVTVSQAQVANWASRSKKFAIFTHAEFIQGRTMDVRFFMAMKSMGSMPDHVFLDQPLGGERYKELAIDVPTTFLGWGANHAAYKAEEKDIDLLWMGHAYEPRQTIVNNLICPLLETGYNVKMHGRGQEHGSLSMPQMFETMSRARILVRISHKAHWEGGYSGRTIYDALASGCYVIHDEYPQCRENFPAGLTFVKVEEIGKQLEHALTIPKDGVYNISKMGYEWVRENGMITHIAQKMLDILEVSG